MKLLENKLFPITAEVGFFEIPIETIAKEFEEWMNRIIINHSLKFSVKLKNCNYSFKDNLNCLLPLTNVDTRRYLLISTKSNWTALFTNRFPFPDVNSPISYLSKKLKCNAIEVTSIENTFDKKTGTGVLGANSFSLYGKEVIEHSNLLRKISVINEGYGWDFENQGKLLDFEDSRIFLHRQKRKRFNSEILKKYLKEFDIDYFNENYYLNKGILIEKEGSLYENMKIFSLDKAQETLNGKYLL